MRRQFKFSKRSIDALPVCSAENSSKETEYSDLEISGLHLLVNRIGRKAFLFRYIVNGRKRAMKVGGYPEMEVIKARETVIEWRGLLAKGIDPQVQAAESVTKAMTLRTFYDDHFKPHIVATKRSAKADDSRFRNHILPIYGDRDMTSICTHEIHKFHNAKKGELCPATANRIFETLRRAYNLANLWGFFDYNPTKGIRPHQEQNRRERYLSEDELARFLKALENEPNRAVADAFLFLLSTGTRREETLKAKWENVDVDHRQWFLPYTKAGKSRFVILNDFAVSVLAKRPRIPGNPYIFAGQIPGECINNPTRAWKRVLNEAGIDPKTTRIHDLRHTYASYLVGVASLHEIAGLLGHSSTNTTARYAHLRNDRLLAASNHVGHLLSGIQAEGQQK